MKKNRIICIFLSVFLLVGMMFVPASADDRVTAGCYSLHAQVPLDRSVKQLDTAKAVVLYELNTDSLVYTWNADQRIDPTGMVKLLTALVALEKGNLDDMVTVYQTTLNTVAIGAVSAGLKAGEQLSLRDLLYCVMVSSANDAAAVIAAHIGGNQGGFAQMLNVKAQELGCTASNFTNAHGLDDPEQYSTARDLAIITEAALENELFVEMFSATEYTVPGTEQHPAPRNLTTTNHMLNEKTGYYDARVTGGKPAAATTTDRSMICTAQIGDAHYLCVVMGVKGQVSSDGLSIIRYGIYEETAALLNYAQNRFAVRQVIDDRDALYQYSVIGGENDVVLQPSMDLSIVLPKDFDREDLRYQQIVDTDQLTAPIEQGQKLGTLHISYGSIIVGRCDLVAMHAVAPDGTTILPAEPAEPDPVEETFDWTKLLTWAALAAGAVLVLVAVILIIVRAVRSANIRRMQRRRARNRKRSKR